MVDKKIEILFSLYKKYFLYNLSFSLISLVSLATSYGAPLLNAVIIDDAIGHRNFYLLIISVVGYCLLNVISDGLTCLISFINIKYQFNVEYYIKNKLLLFFFNCSRIDLKGLTSGEIITVIRDDANKFIQFISNNIQDIIFAFIKIIIAGVLMFRMQVVLGVFVLIIQIILVLLKRLHNKKLAENSIQIRKAHISVVQKLNEISYNIAEIPMIKADKYLIEGYNKAFRDSYLINKANNKVNQSSFFISNLFDILSTCMILLLGGYFVIQEKITIGILISFISYASMITTPLFQLCDLPAQYSIDKESIDTVFKILVKCKSIKNNYEREIGKVSIQSVYINDIKFSYGDDNIIFQGAYAVFDKDKLNYIVGKSGIGKSTLLKLILGYYPIQKGSICFDNKNVSEIVESGEMQYYISWVPQEPIIFHDTVMNNITLGENISKEKIMEVCKKCAILDDIYKLKDGFETLLEESGNNLSVGQKHRLALARALLQNQPIVIIDEATAGIDLLTEQIIKQNLKDSFEGRVVIVVTHSHDFIIEGSRIFEIIDKKIVRKE